MNKQTIIINTEVIKPKVIFPVSFQCSYSFFPKNIEIMSFVASTINVINSKKLYSKLFGSIAI